MATNIGGLSFSISSARNDHWWVSQTSPVEGLAIVPTSVALKYTGNATQPGTYTAELQLDTVNTFTAPVTRTSTGVSDGAVITETFTGLTNATRYYWRVRAQSPYGDWMAWSTVRSFWVLPAGAIATMGVPANIGPDTGAGKDGAEVLHFNVGPPDKNDGPGYVFVNVGPIDKNDAGAVIGFNVGPSDKNDGAGAVLYDVTTNPPIPHIWWLEPESGREGDGFLLVGYGFGGTQAEFAGAVMWQWSESLEVSLPIGTWTAYPASANAYLPARVIDKLAGTIDPAHQKVGVIVPVGALPPGYRVRMRGGTP